MSAAGTGKHAVYDRGTPGCRVMEHVARGMGRLVEGSPDGEALAIPGRAYSIGGCLERVIVWQVHCGP